MIKSITKAIMAVQLIWLLACSSSKPASDSLENTNINAEDGSRDGSDPLNDTLAEGEDSASASGKGSSKGQGSSQNGSKSSGAASSMTIAEGQKRFFEALKNKKYQMASEAAADVLSKDPKDIKILNGLSIMFIQQGKNEMARMFIAKVLSRDPKNAMAFNNLGIVEMRSENLRGALNNFKKAIEFDSNARAAHANLGVIYLQYRNYMGSAAEFKQAVSHGDESPETLSNYGFALRASGQPSEAENAYELALTKDPQNIPALLNYAALLAEQHRDQSKATKFLNKVRQLTQDSATIEKANAIAKALQVEGKQGGKNP